MYAINSDAEERIWNDMVPSKVANEKKTAVSAGWPSKQVLNAR